MKQLYRIVVLLSALFLLQFTSLYANKKFVVVIDPGHGGHDAGAIGKITNEKTINLAVALKLGRMIEKNHSDVKVVYTRKSDVFIPLKRRADIANANHADLFISIHTNAARATSAYGTETFVLGLHKSQANLDVAMRENSVITLEEDYKEKYNGFDPKSIDSYIMFEFLQDRNVDKSLQMASLIEQRFKGIKRHSRGVKQAGFVVLYQTAVPSVLVELGFISNANEERFLVSDSGREQLAASIYRAFAEYKSEHDRKNVVITERVESGSSTPATVEQSSTAELNDNEIVYKIQLFALGKSLSAGHPEFKGLSNVEYYRENNLYKYTYGNEGSFDEIENLRKSIQSKFPGAFVVAFRGNNKISVSEARKVTK